MPAHETGTTTAPGPVLGIDVGGTKVAVAEIDGGRVRAELERPTDTSSASALLDGVEAAAKEVAEEAGRPAAIGVGVPSQVDFATGTVVQSSNIPLAGVALRDELERRLEAPVVVDNDANCAALAEAHAAPEEPVALNLVMLTLGTGVGGGVVIDGRIFRGSSGLGAELGHMVIDQHGPECPGRCPNRGCLEAFCSGTALGRAATDLGREQPGSALGLVVADRGKASARDAAAAAREGNAQGVALLDSLGTRLGIGVASLVNVFEPQRIVIGGGLSAAGDLFIEAARREAAARALPALFERVSLSLARAGPAAGVIGAGLLAANELARGGTAGREATEEGT